jgi:hypothetical protein
MKRWLAIAILALVFLFLLAYLWQNAYRYDSITVPMGGTRLIRTNRFTGRVQTLGAGGWANVPTPIPTPPAAGTPVAGKQDLGRQSVSVDGSGLNARIVQAEPPIRRAAAVDPTLPEPPPGYTSVTLAEEAAPQPLSAVSPGYRPTAKARTETQGQAPEIRRNDSGIPDFPEPADMTVAGLTNEQLEVGESYWVSVAVARLKEPIVAETEVAAALSRAKDFFDEDDRRARRRSDYVPAQKTSEQIRLEAEVRNGLRMSRDTACSRGRMTLPCLMGRLLEPLPDSELEGIKLAARINFVDDDSPRTGARLSAILEAAEREGYRRGHFGIGEDSVTILKRISLSLGQKAAGQ